MADKLLICVSALQATVAHWRGRRIADCRVFGSDSAGLDAFREFLAPLSGVPTYVVVDAVEEDYRFETLPHTFGSDRAEMVDRKLKQHYRNTPYIAAWLQGRDSSKRRDDRYLFSALTNPDLVTGWLEAVAAHELPVAGVYLLPMASAALLDRLQIKATNLLLVARHSGGLRLTFFRDRQFRLSRLTRSDSGRSDNRARFISDEISNTRLYLHALRTITLDEHLTVLLLDREDEFVETASNLARDNPSLDCTRLGRRDISTRLDIAEPLLNASPDVIYLQLLGLKAPESNLAPVSLTTGFRRHQMRRAIYAAAGMAALAAGIWSGINAWQIADARERTGGMARQTASLQTQYQEITRQFPAAPASAENLQRTVEIAQKLRENPRTPETLMHVVSRALDATPTIVLTQLGWKYGQTEIEGGGPAATPAAETPPPSGGTLPRRQSGFITGEIRPFRGDYRAAIETIRGFADRLRRDPAVLDVHIDKLPLNVNPTLALSGNTLDSREQAGSAEFRLALLLK